MKKKKSFLNKLYRFVGILGPGLVTGQVMMSPSGIATYSQTGAAYGLTTLWTALLTFPLMAAIQGMCARIGLVTSNGLAGTIKAHYSKPILYLMLLFSFPAIVMNIGADIAGMGAVGNLLFPSIHPNYFCIAFTIILLVLIVFLPYQKIADILKYLCMVLLVYLIVPFLYRQELGSCFESHYYFNNQIWEKLHQHPCCYTPDYIFALSFLLADNYGSRRCEEKEKAFSGEKRMMLEMKEECKFRTLFSNVVMFFIILTTGTVLFKGGIHQIDTVEQAAQALNL